MDPQNISISEVIGTLAACGISVVAYLVKRQIESIEVSVRELLHEQGKIRERLASIEGRMRDRQ